MTMAERNRKQMEMAAEYAKRHGVSELEAVMAIMDAFRQQFPNEAVVREVAQ